MGNFKEAIKKGSVEKMINVENLPPDFKHRWENLYKFSNIVAKEKYDLDMDKIIDDALKEEAVQVGLWEVVSDWAKGETSLNISEIMLKINKEVLAGMHDDLINEKSLEKDISFEKGKPFNTYPFEDKEDKDNIFEDEEEEPFEDIPFSFEKGNDLEEDLPFNTDPFEDKEDDIFEDEPFEDEDDFIDDKEDDFIEDYLRKEKNLHDKYFKLTSNDSVYFGWFPEVKVIDTSLLVSYLDKYLKEKKINTVDYEFCIDFFDYMRECALRKLNIHFDVNSFNYEWFIQIAKEKEKKIREDNFMESDFDDYGEWLLDQMVRSKLVIERLVDVLKERGK